MKIKSLFLITGTTIIAVALIITATVYFATEKQSEPLSDNNDSALKEQLADLGTLGYVAMTDIAEKDVHKSGVMLNNQDKSYKGINVYGDRPNKIFNFVDMEGKLLHQIRIDPLLSTHHMRIQRYGENFLCLVSGTVCNIDWDSNIKWEAKGQFHHDFCIAENQDIYTITKKSTHVTYDDTRYNNVKSDFIVILNSSGTVKEEISIYNFFKESDLIRKRFPSIPEKEKGESFDIFHANSIEIINHDLPWARKGHILISLKNISLVAVLDLQEKEVVWSWGQGIIEHQHHPSLLDNGNILIFDNGGFYSNLSRSRVIELNPATKTIVWEYIAEPPETFYSRRRGSAYRLPNDNVLITESDKGHVFEVTRKGEIVWDFWNSYVDKKENKRGIIYRMERLAPETLSGHHRDDIKPL